MALSTEVGPDRLHAQAAGGLQRPLSEADHLGSHRDLTPAAPNTVAHRFPAKTPEPRIESGAGSASPLGEGRDGGTASREADGRVGVVRHGPPTDSGPAHPGRGWGRGFGKMLGLAAWRAERLSARLGRRDFLELEPATGSLWVTQFSRPGASSIACRRGT